MEKVTNELNKPEIIARAEEYAKEHDAFQDLLDQNLNKEPLIEAFNELVDELSEPSPEALYDRLLEQMPDAVLTPQSGPFINLRHPDVPEMSFTIRAFENMGSSYLQVEDLQRKWKTPDTNDVKPHESSIQSVRLDDVPKWARKQLIELVQSKAVKLHENAEEASGEKTTPARPARQQILDEDYADLSMRVDYAKGSRGQNKPIVVSPQGRFARVEQQCAWNVINATVEGEHPLPENPNEVAADPRDITDAELRLTESRVRRCLENPDAFAGDKSISKEMFDKRTFFNQLFQIEFGGYTPTRTEGSKNGGMRPSILKLFRRIASDSGFDVLRDYVIPKQEKGEINERQILGSSMTQNRMPKYKIKSNLT